MNLEQELGAVYRRFIARKDIITSEMADVVKGHTDQAFQSEGFTRSAYARWRRKKRYDGFKILHQTGTLSHATYIVRKSWPTIVVKNDTPYADYHNEGDGHVPERHFMDRGPGESPALDRKLDQVMTRNMNIILNG